MQEALALEQSRQSVLTIKQVAVIDRAERFLETGGAIPADRQEAVRQVNAALAANAVQALANRLRNSSCDRLSGKVSRD